MPASVAVNTRHNQIFRRIIAGFGLEIQMIDDQQFCGNGILTSPAIPVQDLKFECCRRGNPRIA